MPENIPSITEAEDQQLVFWAMEGQMIAYDELVRRYQQYLATCLFRFCLNQADLEDLIQDTFIRAFKKLDKWKPTFPFRSWIRRIGYNLGYDYLRKNKRNPLKLVKTKIPNERFQEEDPLDAIRSAEADLSEVNSNQDLVQWLLQHLKPDETMIITMLYVEELSVREISERTGWSESKVKVKAFRVRKKLKHIFDHHETKVFEFSVV